MEKATAFVYYQIRLEFTKGGVAIVVITTVIAGQLLVSVRSQRAQPV